MIKRKSKHLFKTVWMTAALLFLLLFCRTVDVKAGSCESIAVESQDNGNGIARIVIDGVELSEGSSGIVVPVWSRSDQSDLVWYAANKETDSRYFIDINVANHRGRYALYYADVYEDSSKGVVKYLGGTTVTFSISKGETSVQRMNFGSTYRFQTAGFTVPGSVKKAVMAVWSAEGGQDDLTWNQASFDASGFVQCDFAADRLKHAGTVYVDTYLELTDGSMHCVGSRSFEYSGNKCESVSIEGLNNAEGTCSVVVRGVTAPSGIQEIVIPVWSVADQSDLVWYQAEAQGDGSYVVKVDIARHNDNIGTYYADTYITDGYGRFECMASNTFVFEEVSVPAGEVGISIKTDQKAGSFEIEINGSGIGEDVKAVIVPTWSAKDQSDLVWYEAKKNKAGNYVVSSDISKHKYNAATYYVDVYGRNAKGKMTFLNGETMSFEIENQGITADSKDGRQYTLTIKSLVVPAEAKEVSFAVWSEKNGQDDLHWYKASGKNGGDYTGKLDLAKHKTEGAYIVDAYVQTKGGKMVFLGRCNDVKAEASAKAQISVSESNSMNGCFEVLISLSDISPAIESLVVPTWCAEDQSDIKWYHAEAVDESTYKLTVDIRNHKNHSGTYHIHVYGNFENGLFSYIGKEDYFFDADGFLAVSGADGSYTRRVSYTSSVVDTVTFAVWTKEGGQDDLVWYHGKQASDGTFYADIKSSKHKHSGTYIVHVYVGEGAEQIFATDTTFVMIDYLEYAIKIAGDDSVGYSQAYRYLNPDVDCSSLVYYALYNSGFSGILGNSPFYTGSEVYLLQKCGFRTLAFTGMNALQPGDILWYRYGTNGHTEIYVGDGMNVGAHDSVVDGVDYPQGGDQTGREVSVSAFSTKHQWIYVLRLYDL